MLVHLKCTKRFICVKNSKRVNWKRFVFLSVFFLHSFEVICDFVVGKKPNSIRFFLCVCVFFVYEKFVAVNFNLVVKKRNKEFLCAHARILIDTNAISTIPFSCHTILSLGRFQVICVNRTKLFFVSPECVSVAYWQ